MRTLLEIMAVVAVVAVIAVVASANWSDCPTCNNEQCSKLPVTNTMRTQSIYRIPNDPMPATTMERYTPPNTQSLPARTMETPPTATYAAPPPTNRVIIHTPPHRTNQHPTSRRRGLFGRWRR